MKISQKYQPYIVILGIAIALVLAGVSSASEAGVLPSVQADTMLGNTDAIAQPAAALVAPAARETTASMQNPSDSMAIVLSGEMGNGGFWTWEDIGNLLGVYGTYGAYTQTVVDGLTVNGVPLSYLLHYVRINAYATVFVVTDRGEQRFTFAVSDLVNCAACTIALMPDNTLSLSLPGFEPAAIHGLMRIDAYEGAPAVLPVQEMPVDPQTVTLNGRFARGGEWNWNDISNLLGVYSTYNAYVTVTVSEQDYVGVPLSYLFDYAGIDATANAIVVYDRAGDVTSAPASALQASCTDCIIAQAQDGTLSLVMPGHEPAVIAQLAALEVR